MMQQAERDRWRGGAPLLFGLLLLTESIIATGCGSKPSTTAKSSPAAPAPAAVDVAPVRTERLVETVEAVGTLDANEKVLVKPEIAGRISRLAFDEGQSVKKGDILVELDAGKLQQDVEVAGAKHRSVRQTILEQREQLAAARARIAEARAGIEQARQTVRELQARLTRADAALERARQDESRTRALFEKEFKTQDDLEKTVTMVKQAEADRTAVLAELTGPDQKAAAADSHPRVRQAMAALDAARAQQQALIVSLGDAADTAAPADGHPEVLRALAEVNLAKEKLRDLILTAPMDGILAGRRAAVGDFVDKGALIFELIDLTSVKTSFRVPERYLSRIRTGQSAEVRVAPYPEEVFRGVISYIDPSVDETSRTVLMKMRIPNAGMRLKPGLFANVQIVIGQFPNALAIPEEAVVPQGGQTFAFVVENESVHLRPIRIGLRFPGKVQVLDGLAPDEIVVVAGIQKIRDGSAIRISASGDGRTQTKQE